MVIYYALLLASSLVLFAKANVCKLEPIQRICFNAVDETLPIPSLLPIFQANCLQLVHLHQRFVLSAVSPVAETTVHPRGREPRAAQSTAYSRIPPEWPSEWPTMALRGLLPHLPDFTQLRQYCNNIVSLNFDCSCALCVQRNQNGHQQAAHPSVLGTSASSSQSTWLGGMGSGPLSSEALRSESIEEEHSDGFMPEKPHDGHAVAHEWPQQRTIKMHKRAWGNIDALRPTRGECKLWDGVGW